MECGGQHWRLPTAKTSYPELVPLIHAAPPLKGVKSVGVLYTEGLAIHGQSKNAEAAFEFLKWYSKVENNVAYAEINFSIPARKSAIRTNYVQTTHIITDKGNRSGRMDFRHIYCILLYRNVMMAATTAN